MKSCLYFSKISNQKNQKSGKIFLPRRHLYVCDSESKKTTMGWAFCCDGETKNAYRILVGKSLGKRPLGRPMIRKETLKYILGKYKVKIGGG
jgi:hypothetical protein